MNNDNFIVQLVKPNSSKPQGRKSWSIDLETVWLPFFHSTNVKGVTKINPEALGAPLRLAYNPDNSVRFSKAGKPVIRICKDISDNVKLVRDNFIAGLQAYASDTAKELPEAYQESITNALKAGKPIIDRDLIELDHARDLQLKAQLDAMNKETAPQSAPELITA